MSLTNYGAQNVLDAIFGDRAGTFTVPWSALYVGLSSTTPAEAGTGVTEPSGGSYARVQVTAAIMDAATSADPSVKDNGTAITFPTATADWVSAANLTHWVLYDAASGGNLIAFAALDVAKPVTNGDTAELAAGDFSLSMD